MEKNKDNDEAGSIKIKIEIESKNLVSIRNKL